MPILLQINVTANWGSTGKIADQIGLCAMYHGWDSYIAYGRMMNPSKNNLIKIGSLLDVYEHYVENRFFDNEGLASRHATKIFLEKLDEIKPDIVHLHNIHDHYINYRLLFSYLIGRKIPVVWTQHDCWAFTGGCMYYDSLNCNKWKTGCKSCPEHRAFLSDRTEKQYNLKKSLLNQITNLTLVPVSHWLESCIRDSFLNNKSIITIHNGIDTNQFQPISPKLQDDKFRILGCASVWSRRKGLEDFIKLRLILPSNFEIILVGLSNKQIREIPSGIIGISRTNSVEELARLYSIADIYVNLTYSDNFPTTNLEALACGTPVITYCTGGSSEAIDEKTGVVIEQGNIDALVTAIQEIKERPFSSIDCRKRAMVYFNKNKCFEEYIKLYKNLI